jgi:hypothetical protein
MDTDDNQSFGILLFESPQLRKDMGAVDSTVGPEIQNHNLASELFHRQRTVGIDPLQGIGKFWCGQLAGKGTAAHGISRIFKRPTSL